MQLLLIEQRLLFFQLENLLLVNFALLVSILEFHRLYHFFGYSRLLLAYCSFF